MGEREKLTINKLKKEMARTEKKIPLWESEKMDRERGIRESERKKNRETVELRRI